MGFQDIMSKIAAQDGVKAASANTGGGTGGGNSAAAPLGEEDGAVKTAMFYEDVGRELARSVYSDLAKQASAENHQEKVAAVLKRMADDPAYAAELVRRHGASVGIQ